MESVEQPGLWRHTALRQHHLIGRGCFAIQVGQDSLDHRRIFNAGDDPDLTTAPIAGLDVEHPLESLHPSHRGMALGGRLVQPVFPGRLMPLASPAPFSRRDTHTKFAVRSEHPMKTSKIYAWLGYKGSYNDDSNS